MRRFSELLSSAALLKLEEPVMTTELSMIITLLCAMAWEASMKVGMPAPTSIFKTEYRWALWLLSRMTCTYTPRSLALIRASAMGTEVNEYA